MFLELDSFAAQADFDGKTVYAITTHGGSGIANSVRDFQETSGASVDENVLAVYDKDVVNSREQVTRWLESLGGEVSENSLFGIVCPLEEGCNCVKNWQGQ